LAGMNMLIGRQKEREEQRQASLED
jgi:hypothetical protein